MKPRIWMIPPAGLTSSIGISFHYYLSNEFQTQVAGTVEVIDVITPTW